MINSKPAYGVLTSGGDAPGMNAAIRAVVRACAANGIYIYGIDDGYNGLIYDRIHELNVDSVSGIINRGGTILHTARSPQFKTAEGMKKAVENAKTKGLDGIIVIGGDGSFKGARDLSNGSSPEDSAKHPELARSPLPCVAIPGTIDNDIAASDYTIGYDTAMNTAMDMIDKLRDTAQAHYRCSVVEVMGAHSGHIALNTGIACGATVVLVPEKHYDSNTYNFSRDVSAKIRTAYESGRQHYIVVVAEGLGMAGTLPDGVEGLARQIQEEIHLTPKRDGQENKVETRATRLGHVQRGGSPTLRDRVAATEMGYQAVKLLQAGKKNLVVVMNKGAVISVDINEALALPKKDIDEELYAHLNEMTV
ncbi:MAG: 6-phosphofructokinase [Oscillospiraceae bacterium]|jgi:6-phosphofructokinase 1|nr:6-phosphofructokinase [Oscillospiraceae bacterium]